MFEKGSSTSYFHCNLMHTSTKYPTRAHLWFGHKQWTQWQIGLWDYSFKVRWLHIFPSVSLMWHKYGQLNCSFCHWSIIHQARWWLFSKMVHVYWNKLSLSMNAVESFETISHGWFLKVSIRLSCLYYFRFFFCFFFSWQSISGRETFNSPFLYVLGNFFRIKMSEKLIHNSWCM